MTTTTPFVETNEPVPYLGLPATVPMTRIADSAAGFGRIYAWLAMQGLAPSGASFFRYFEFHKNGLVDMQIGVPAAANGAKEAGFVEDTLPAGRYLSLLHAGDYSGLPSSTFYLMKWAEEHRLKFQCQEENLFSLWKARVEWYLVGPTKEPDPSARLTKISILLA